MPIFEIPKDRLVELQPTAFSSHGLRERGDLQRLLREQVEIIAPDVLIVSEEFGALMQLSWLRIGSSIGSTEKQRQG